MSISFNPAIMFATHIPEYGTGKHLLTTHDYYKICENDPYQKEQILIDKLITEIPNGMQTFYVSNQFNRQITGQKILQTPPITRVKLIKAAILRVLFIESLQRPLGYYHKRHYRILCDGLITNLLKRTLPFTFTDFKLIVTSIQSLQKKTEEPNYFVVNFPYERFWKAIETQLKKAKEEHLSENTKNVLVTLKQITPYKIALHQQINKWLNNADIKLSTHDIFGKTVMQFLKTKPLKEQQIWKRLLLLCREYDSDPQKITPKIKTIIEEITPSTYYEAIAKWLHTLINHEPNFDFGNLLVGQNQHILQNLINTIVYLRHPLFWRMIAKLGIKAHHKGDKSLTEFCISALKQSTQFDQNRQTIGDNIMLWLGEKTYKNLIIETQKEQTES